MDATPPTPIPPPDDDELAAEIEAELADAEDDDDEDDDHGPDPIPEPDWSERANWLDSLTKFVKEADGIEHPGVKLTIGEVLYEVRRLLGRLR